MNKITTSGIILTRTDYGEADRIITFLTPDKGKVSAIAKGVRRSSSRLAGGIELFSVSTISYMEGKGLHTLVSTKLDKYYASIVKDIERTMAGYAVIKMLHRATQDQTETGYFTLLQEAFEALDEPKVHLAIIDLWFRMQLLRMAGIFPNLETDSTGTKLAEGTMYIFSEPDMTFTPKQGGLYGTDFIKFLRIGFSHNKPRVLQQIANVDELLPDVIPLIQSMYAQYIRE